MTNHKSKTESIRGVRNSSFSTFKHQLDFDVLLSAALKRSKEFLYAHDEYCLSAAETRRFKSYLKDYTNGYSLAAIIGHKEFYGRNFYVNKQVLIPRPDTEILVLAAITKINSLADKNLTLIDVGTGSGCIPISIKKEVNKKNIPTIAIDISPAALTIAKTNAKQRATKISFVQGSLLSPVLSTTNKKLKSSTIIITANLPYLTEKQLRSEPSIRREPRLALVAKDHGLALYKTLFRQTKKLVRYYQPAELWLFIEIDPSQNKPLIYFIKTVLPKASINTLPDLAGLDRVIAVNLVPPLTHNNHRIRHKHKAPQQKK